MNGLKNSILLIGNLGRDPETKTLESGRSFARFTMATSESYRNANGDKVTSTQWHNIVAWGKTAEVAGNLLKKGKEVAVRGKLTYRNYKDKEGIDRSIPEVVVDEFALLSKP
ncbi:MAG TPA: single-stranded DNA-binding protein [Flavilitoribacter sp.]|nr:single-stranded DNA-binding protein [Flavilitoribacter sp.]HMQ88060.1 single-stranded DNA-binding protein [Flavilitoribacter sp.]